MPSIRFIPIDKLAQDIDPPKPAKVFLPDWYKNMVSDIPGVQLTASSTTSTVKRCMPVFDYLTAGYVIPFWADVSFINTPCDDPDCKDFVPQAHWRTQNTVIETHSSEQFSGMPVPDYFYSGCAFKLINRFLIQTPPGYSTMFLPVLELSSLLYALPGIVDTDKHPVAINFPFFIKDRFEGVIEKDTPLVRVVPFKRESWNGKLEEAQEEKIKREEEKLHTKFYRVYKNQFWTKKQWS